jgi:hypothetical protein
MGSGLRAHPRRFQVRDALIDRTGGNVSTGQVTGAQKKFSRYLSTRKQERRLEQPHPLGLAPRVMCIQPLGKAAVAVPNLDDASRVLDDRVDLLLVSNDAGVSEETGALSAPVATRSASNPSNAARKFSRFLRIVSQERPA